jgi:SAM-dependent methyltransferase
MGRKPLFPGLTVKSGFLRHPFDIEYGVQTSGLVAGRHLTTGHLHDRHNTAYYGVAPSVLETLLRHWRALPLVGQLKDYTFVDFGAGMGRAVLLASRLPFREVVGVELNPVLATTAQKNAKTWQMHGFAKSPIRIVCQDAVEFVFPQNPCVAFLFNPFREPLVRTLKRHMERSFTSRPGQIDVLYANNEFASVFERNLHWREMWRGDVALSPGDYAADKEILDHQPDGEYISSAEEASSIYRWVGRRREVLS